ncbi:carbohydrate ABC transporter membrane protein 2 (CUT1 family) [Paenibacillus cellulosilyticus]|uniref:Carbohydrate ABC transporter membrane protein 2 (CUT1 family) n=1 Tax=Paenibacillus cellulosilyticus TaxID=375489 RepID=A0A2V2YVW7_9BACL|nr:carbohydrate ABC transporter permease [Paenibacillus cellulosilyticus]PWW05239.1 carbohydrate ABC transporter membrane protein 2 (CUT1 family) [Paenibacillus cellulosilyticus]QKS43563.1 carbohydrate ABC transporter permease [Paenibacillus cellulosilyticus]
MHSRFYGSRLFDGFNVIILTLLGVITLYPFWDTLVVSLSPLDDNLSSAVHLFPRHFTLAAYDYIFGMKELWTSYGVTIFVTVVGTLISMLFTVLAAYPLSKSSLKGTRVIMFLFVFTMMFSGGIIPTYLVVKNTGLMNSVWALIIPTVIFTYNLILMRTFFQTIPESLEDSAKIDGCSDVGVLFRIVLPLSLPSLATITLFYAVARWNEYFNAIFYITDHDLWPLQLFLRGMLFQNEAAYMSGGESTFLLGPSVKMASVMAAALPILLLYPFFQKYFVKGAMLGAVKE